MKILDDDYDDYFEKSAPQKPKPVHEETAEEREERELIETTIERRRNKKRLWLLVGCLVVLVVIILLVHSRYFSVYQQSDVKGRVAEMALRGSVFPTYEGKLIVYDVVSEGNVVQSDFRFTVADDSLVHTLSRYKQTPVAVKLKYKEYKTTVPWRGETKYIVTAVDSVDVNCYVNAVKQIPIPVTERDSTK